MRPSLLITAAVSALVYPVPALSAEIEASSVVDRVVVYPDGASVTRVMEVDLPAGRSDLVLRGLSPLLEAASVRADGEASRPFQIASVDSRSVPADPQASPDPALSQKIKSLREERAKVGVQILAAETRRDAIKVYAQASPEKLSSEARPLDIGQWSTAWDALGSGMAKVADELRVLTARASEIDAQIAAAERARPRQPGLGGPRRDVIIAVEAISATRATLRLTYRVSGARWRPVYDAQLTTAGGKPSLEFTRRAEISQRTGEDWTNTQLSVSTVPVQAGTAAPDLWPSEIRFELPRPPAPVPMELERDAAAAQLQARREAETMQRAAAAPAEEVGAELQAGPYQATFALPGRTTLAGDGTARTLRLASRTIAPELLVRAAPELDPTAYLEAYFRNEEGAPVLPGEVSLIRDGTFIGRGSLPLVAPGDEMRVGFGADESVRVERQPVQRRETEPSFLGSTRTDTREFLTKITNNHTFPVKVRLTDRIPFSENAAITIEQIAQTTPPTQSNVDGKRGVLAWDLDLKPREVRQVRLAYRIRWPADRYIIVFP